MHLTDTQINDLVDETLSTHELTLALQHVNHCAQCRAEVEELRTMLHRIAQLPAVIPPSRDMRSDMWAKVDRKTLWSFRYPLAAAAVLLIALSSAITVLVLRPETAPQITVMETQTTPSVDLISLEREYSQEVEELQRALRQDRESLSPETVQILEENLRIIDAAIQEARTALATDPQSGMLGELLRSAYQRKVELLKQAARSSATT
jgi:bacterioferritin-associated ferredoxin